MALLGYNTIMGKVKDLIIQSVITSEDVKSIIADCKFCGVYLYLDKEASLCWATENIPIPRELLERLTLSKSKLESHLASVSYLDS